MDGLNFKLDNSPVWYGGDHKIFDNTELSTYSTGDRKKIAFLISPLTTKIRKEIRSNNKINEPEIPSNSFTLMNLDKFDEDKIEEDLVDYIIADWKGILVDGKEFPCTRENKLLFANNFQDLAQALIRSAKYANTIHDKVEDKERKNLGSLADGLENVDS